MKVVLTRLKPRKKGLVRVKRVRNADGRIVTVRSLDASSRTFGSDLRGIFATNVSKARKDNKAIAGVRDRVPTKR
jgi:hypothetical protein